MLDISKKQSKYDQLYMDIALRLAEMSYAVRAKVGAIMVKDGNIIGTGWNGMPAGMNNCCETKSYWMPQYEDLHPDELDLLYPYSDEDGRYLLKTRPEVSHAEENMLGKILQSTQSCKDATVYVTLEPCINCAKLLYTAGVSRVVIGARYKNDSGSRFLIARGIEINFI